MSKGFTRLLTLLKRTTRCFSVRLFWRRKRATEEGSESVTLFITRVIPSLWRSGKRPRPSNKVVRSNWAADVIARDSSVFLNGVMNSSNVFSISVWDKAGECSELSSQTLRSSSTVSSREIVGSNTNVKWRGPERELSQAMSKADVNGE